ncbi:MAG: alpha/beta fold hydrolase [Lachnospiraceae bacterium]
MKTRNKLLTLLTLSAAAAAGIAFINKAIKFSATSKGILDDPDSLCFKWRLGNIHYTKEGSGKPILLVHDLNPSSSSYEWREISKKLSEKYTVYTIDLLGFGPSEKPNLTYTNYLYVQLLSDFIKSEIGRRTDIITSGSSASLAIMACCNDSELFDKLMFINPDSLLSCSLIPGKKAKMYKFILDLPIAGTFIYHISCSKKSITNEFVTNYFYNPYTVKAQMIDAFHEAAHLGESPKSIFACVKCNYTKCNIVNSLKKIDNSIYLIGSSEIEGMNECMEEYKECNPAIEYTSISHTKKLPQLENPSELLNMIQTYLS